MEMKRLLLVLPRNERGFWGKVTNGKTGFVRLSLPTLAALTPDDWQVSIHDARVDPVDYEQKVDLVGITAFTAEIPPVTAPAMAPCAAALPTALQSFTFPSVTSWVAASTAPSITAPTTAPTRDARNHSPVGSVKDSGLFPP